MGRKSLVCTRPGLTVALPAPPSLRLLRPGLEHDERWMPPRQSHFRLGAAAHGLEHEWWARVTTGLWSEILFCVNQHPKGL